MIIKVQDIQIKIKVNCIICGGSGKMDIANGIDCYKCKGSGHVDSWLTCGNDFDAFIKQLSRLGVGITIVKNGDKFGLKLVDVTPSVSANIGKVEKKMGVPAVVSPEKHLIQ